MAVWLCEERKGRVNAKARRFCGEANKRACPTIHSHLDLRNLCLFASLTNTRQLFADKGVNHAHPTNASASHDHAGVIGGGVADQGGIAA